MMNRFSENGVSQISTKISFTHLNILKNKLKQIFSKTKKIHKNIFVNLPLCQLQLCPLRSYLQVFEMARK